MRKQTEERIRAKGTIHEGPPEQEGRPNGDGRKRTRPNSDYGADGDIIDEVGARWQGNAAEWANPSGRRRRSRDFVGKLLTSTEFMATMHPPEFVVDDLLMAGSTYTMTGRTGSGKTIAALLIGKGVATGGGFCGRMCQQGSVAFFAGENPDNVKMQWFSLCRDLGIDPASLPIHWYAGIFDVNRAIAKVREVLRDIPDLKLVIIDSLQAYFTGEDDSQNMDMLDLAADFREMTEGHPNRPAGIVIAHPVKNAARDNLLPRGGSALLNELDGNLTTWLDDGIVTLHWQGKYRGVPFDPIEMEAVVVKPEGLVTADGRQMPCTILRPVMSLRKAEIAKDVTRRKRLALAAIKANPEISVQEIATAIGRSKTSGQRMVEELLKDKWIKRYAGRLKLTAEGEKVLDLS